MWRGGTGQSAIPSRDGCCVADWPGVLGAPEGLCISIGVVALDASRPIQQVVRFGSGVTHGTADMSDGKCEWVSRAFSLSPHLLGGCRQAPWMSGMMAEDIRRLTFCASAPNRWSVEAAVHCAVGGWGCCDERSPSPGQALPACHATGHRQMVFHGSVSEGEAKPRCWSNIIKPPMPP